MSPLPHFNTQPNYWVGSVYINLYEAIIDLDKERTYLLETIEKTSLINSDNNEIDMTVRFHPEKMIHHFIVDCCNNQNFSMKIVVYNKNGDITTEYGYVDCVVKEYEYFTEGKLKFTISYEDRIELEKQNVKTWKRFKKLRRILKCEK